MQLAAERTLLAWVRSGLAMMGFGFVVARFGLFLRELLAAQGVTVAHTSDLSRWVGTALVTLGVLVNVASAVQYWRRMRRLARGELWQPRPLSLATLLALVLALVGLLMAAYLLVAA